MIFKCTVVNMDRSAANNHSNQMNPNNSAYWSSRDNSSRPSDWSGNYHEYFIIICTTEYITFVAGRDYSGYDYSRAEVDNRATQLNPNSSSYASSRGNK